MTMLEQEFQEFHSRLEMIKWVALFILLAIFITYSSFTFHDGLENSIVIAIIIIIFIRTFIFKLSFSRLYLSWLKRNNHREPIELFNITLAMLAQDLIRIKSVRKSKLNPELLDQIFSQYNKDGDYPRGKDLFKNRIILKIEDAILVPIGIIIIFWIGFAIVDATGIFEETNIYFEGYTQEFTLSIGDSTIHKINFIVDDGCYYPTDGGHGHCDFGVWKNEKTFHYAGGGGMRDDDSELHLFNPGNGLIYYAHPYIKYPLKLNNSYKNNQLYYHNEMIGMFDYKADKISSIDKSKIIEIKSSYKIIDTLSVKVNNKVYKCWKITAYSSNNKNDSIFHSEFIFNDTIGFVGLKYIENNIILKLENFYN